jgi:hypothetical protein
MPGAFGTISFICGSLQIITVIQALVSTVKCIVKLLKYVKIWNLKISTVRIGRAVNCVSSLLVLYFPVVLLLISLYVFRRVSQIAKSDSQFRHVCPSAFGSHWTDFHEVWY